MCASAMCVLGSSFPISRLVVAYPTLISQSVRYLLATVLLAIAVGWTSRRDGAALTAPGPAGMPGPDGVVSRPAGAAARPVRAGDLPRLAALAATGLAGFNICVLATLRHADAATLGTIVGAVPLLLALLGPLLARRAPSARLGLCAAVVVVGVVLVEGGGQIRLTGLAWAGGALLGEAAFSLIAVPLLDVIGPIRVSAWSCGLAVPMLLIASVVTGEQAHWRAPTASETAALLYLAVVLTAITFLIWYGGIRRLGVERAGLFAGLVPVTALIGQAILDRSWPIPLQLAGTLIVAAGLLAGLSAGQRRRAPQPTGPAPKPTDSVPKPTGPAPRPTGSVPPDHLPVRPSEPGCLSGTPAAGATGREV